MHHPEDFIGRVADLNHFTHFSEQGALVISLLKFRHPAG